MNRKIKQNSKITIDKLALMIGRGFKGIDERFNVIDGRFRGIDGRFKGIDERFEAIEEKLDRIETKLDSLERRIVCIEDILTEHGRDIRKMKNDIEWIKAELQELKKTDNGNSDKIFELDQRVKVLEVKIG